MKALHTVADYLLEVGGSDIVIRPHGMYEVSVRKLDDGEAESAAEKIIEEVRHGRTAD